MQEKNSPSPKKNFSEAQAPNLIAEIKRRLGMTQQELSGKLGITQQAVSNYEAGKVRRERYDIIKRLENLLAACDDIILQEIIYHEYNDKKVVKIKQGGKMQAEKKGPSHIQAGRSKTYRRKK